MIFGLTIFSIIITLVGYWFIESVDEFKKQNRD